MSVDIDTLTSDITKRTVGLASCDMGEGHDNFLNGIIVQFDLTYTVKCWTEAERYHFFDFVSSQSTMHRIAKFDLDKAYIKYVDPLIIEIMKKKVNEYNMLTNKLARIRDGATEDYSEKELLEILTEKYLEILYSNPCGFRLTARMTTNYRQLKTIYHQRKNHRLPEWKAFCRWVESLPRFKELILKESGEANE
jgi:hypothetical protein